MKDYLRKIHHIDKYIILISLLIVLGIIGAIYQYNDLATWYGGVATVASVIFAYLGLKDTQESHKATLDIYVNLNLPAYLNDIGDNKAMINIPGLYLNITPVNNGIIAGSFRFLGICKGTDWCILKQELQEAKKKQQFNGKIFVDKMYFINNEVTPEDLPQPEGKVEKELSGSDLLFPTKNKFERIETKTVGKIRNIPYAYGSSEIVSISDKLSLDTDKGEKLVVVYIDPTFKPYVGSITIDSNLINQQFNKIGITPIYDDKQ